MAGFAFIDDTNLIVNNKTNMAVVVIGKIHASLIMCHGLLGATEGDLVPDKCYWYLLDFHWENNQWWYKTQQDTLGKLQVTTDQKQTIAIPRLEASEARCTLGVCIAPDGNNRDN